jgi:hypothetical protein
MAVRQLLPVAAAAGNAIYPYLPSMPSFRGPSEQKLVNRVIRAAHELKCVDNYTYFSLNTTYSQTLLNGIGQGSAGTTRTGRIVKPESVEITLYANMVTTALGGDVLRVIVYRDNECRGVAAGQADLLANNSSQFEAIISALNFDNVPTRFKILHDSLIVFNPSVAQTTTTVNPETVCKKLTLSPGGPVHYYNTTGVTIADIDSGAIYLMVFGVNATNTSDLTVYSRFTFRDV